MPTLQTFLQVASLILTGVLHGLGIGDILRHLSDFRPLAEKKEVGCLATWDNDKTAAEVLLSELQQFLGSMALPFLPGNTFNRNVSVWGEVFCFRCSSAKAFLVFSATFFAVNFKKKLVGPCFLNPILLHWHEIAMRILLRSLCIHWEQIMVEKWIEHRENLYSWSSCDKSLPQLPRPLRQHSTIDQPAKSRIKNWIKTHFLNVDGSLGPKKLHIWSRSRSI